MKVYRIDRIKYADQVLSGIGAAKFGGRWNELETPAVYGSESRSLALLEILVQLRKNDYMPNDKIVVTLDVNEEHLLKLRLDDLPPYWNSLPQPHPNTKKLLQQHCVKGSYLGLQVPSVVMQEEYNIVLYPLFKDYYQSVRVENIQALQWDARLGRQ